MLQMRKLKTLGVLYIIVLLVSCLGQKASLEKKEKDKPKKIN
jgi:hypothetical protein